MSDTVDISLRDRIFQIEDLPTLPRVATQIMEITSDPPFSVKALEEIMSQDPPLSAKILQMANSAFYGLRNPVDSIRRAMLVLGVRELEQIVLSLSVFKAFRTVPGQAAFDREKFWEHSLCTGIIARVFIQKLREIAGQPLGDEGEVAFSAGLLHDLGKIIFDYKFHLEFNRAVNLVAEGSLSMQQAENLVFGEDHAVVGSWLAEHWKLPENIVMSIRYHHQPELCSEYHLLVVAVHLANLFSKVGGTGFGDEEVMIGFRSLPAWRILRQLVPEVDSIDLERFTFELDREFEKARGLLEIFQS